jgi:hypothetical protein
MNNIKCKNKCATFDEIQVLQAYTLYPIPIFNPSKCELRVEIRTYKSMSYLSLLNQALFITNCFKMFLYF